METETSLQTISINPRVVSIVCHECMPKENYPLPYNAKGDWYVDREAGKAWCTNCYVERPYKTRSTDKRQPTKSQQKEIKRIKSWFEYKFKNQLTKGFHRFEIKHQVESGLTWVYIETSPNLHIAEGCSLSIGPRGRVVVYSSVRLSDVYDKEYYAESLGGHVSEY